MAGPNLPITPTAGSSGHVAHHDAMHDIVNAFDTAIGSSPAANSVLVWNGTVYAPADLLAVLPAGVTLTVTKSGGTWPARPTSRADVVVQWKGADPSPAIVSSGTGGMLNGVDIRLITT